MKKLFYFIYSVFFRVGRLLPLKKNLVALVSPHPASFNDSLGEIRTKLGEKGGFEFLTISSAEIKGSKNPASVFRFFVVKSARLARAHYVFLNDNFMPLADVRFRKETVVTQLWHGEGALKKIGLATSLPPEIEARERRLYKNYDYAVCSSKSVVSVYTEAFDMREEQVLPLGTPRTDYFFRPFDYEKARAEFDRAHPGCKGKKLVLYAPTYRDDPALDSHITENISAEKFNARFGETAALLIRLHPQVRSAIIPAGVTDVTDYPDIGKLLRLADVLITDYSSVCMDFALMNKPSFYYPYDLENYMKNREFYADYESIVPGPVCRDFDSLLDAVGNMAPDEAKLEKFREYHLGACDGHSAERVIKAVMGI